MSTQPLPGQLMSQISEVTCDNASDLSLTDKERVLFVSRKCQVPNWFHSVPVIPLS